MNGASRYAAFLLLAALVVLGYFVLRNFIAPLLWAGILAYVAWPGHQRIQRRFGSRQTLAALTTTSILTVAIVLPVTALAFMLQRELLDAYRGLRDYLAAGGPTVPTSIAELPWIGPRAYAWITDLSADPTVISDRIAESADRWLEVARNVLSAISRSVFKFAITVLALFFMLRDGELLVSQTRTVLHRFLGPGYSEYWDAVASTTRGVVYGLVLTALAQGLFAGLGYWAAGMRAPVLMGALTALLALVPFGAPIVWGSVGVGLILAGFVWPGIGVLLWGALVVSWIDNIVRPLAISTATRTPFLLVLVGVLGGLTTFGLIGLFIGPMVLAVLLAVWREWLEQSEAEAARRKPDPIDR